MSVRLHAHGKPARGFETAVLGRIATAPVDDPELRQKTVLCLPHLLPSLELDGYAGILSQAPADLAHLAVLEGSDVAWIHRVPSLDHLEAGDVVALNPNGYVRTLYRSHSLHNAIFATDQCNSWCLMCSQPPRPIDDSDRIAEHLRLLELIGPECPELGITGGEPTLLKRDLLRLVARCSELLPTTALHVLSNGRLFYYGAFARELADVGHPDLMIGIPLYSSLAYEHDFVVQRRGAFRETLIGIQNLGRFGVRVEIRTVVHRLTYRGLHRLAEYIYRNLPFAAHVAFMGLEPMGFAVPNLDQLWIDPWDYRPELEEAVVYLDAVGMNVSIYNHPLCVLPQRLWPHARRSISDWKNDYLPECEGCTVREDCCGFFSSALVRRRSAHVRPLLERHHDRVSPVAPASRLG